jgi:hypothetical protein
MKVLVFGKFKREIEGRKYCMIKVYLEDTQSGISGMLNLTVLLLDDNRSHLEEITHDFSILADDKGFSLLREQFQLKLDRELRAVVHRAIDSCECHGWDGELPEPRYLDAEARAERS